MPIDIIVDPDGGIIRIAHFKSLIQSQGHATNALNRIIETGKKNNYDKIILHMGTGRPEDDVEGFLTEHMGFKILNSTDKIEAVYPLD